MTITAPTAKILKPLVGKRIRWRKPDRKYRGYIYPGDAGVGVVVEVKGRNLHLNESDWLWIPDLASVEVIEGALP